MVLAKRLVHSTLKHQSLLFHPLYNIPPLYRLFDYCYCVRVYYMYQHKTECCGIILNIMVYIHTYRVGSLDQESPLQTLYSPVEGWDQLIQLFHSMVMQKVS